MPADQDPPTSNDPNVKFLQRTIHNMENELSAASFGGDRKQIPLLMKQLKQARRILAKMTGEDWSVDFQQFCTRKPFHLNRKPASTNTSVKVASAPERRLMTLSNRVWYLSITDLRGWAIKFIQVTRSQSMAWPLNPWLLTKWYLSPWINR